MKANTVFAATLVGICVTWFIIGYMFAPRCACAQSASDPMWQIVSSLKSMSESLANIDRKVK